MADVEDVPPLLSQRGRCLCCSLYSAPRGWAGSLVLTPHHPLSLPICVCVRGLRVIHELLLGALSSWWQLCSSSGAWIFSPIPSLLLFVNELWPNLSQEMPLQSSQPVFGRLTPAEEIPRDPSEPSIQTKSSRLCLLTPSDGDTPNLPSRAVLCSRAQFSQGRSRGAGFCTSSHVAGTGKGSTGLASQTRVTWQQFGCRGCQNTSAAHPGVLQPASPSSGRRGHGIPTSRDVLSSQILDLDQGFLPCHFSSTTICDPFTAERKPKVLCQQ